MAGSAGQGVEAAPVAGGTDAAEQSLVPLVPLILAGPLSTVLAAAGDARSEPAAQRPAGRVTADRLGERELAVAEDVVATWGGELRGVPGFPGIDALFEGEPVLLRWYGERSPDGVPALLDRAEDGARKAGYSGVDLYLDAREVPTAALTGITVPDRGVVRRVLVRTADGWFLMPGPTP